MSAKDRPQSTDAVAMSRDGGWLALTSRAGLEVWAQASRKRTVVRALPRFKGKVWQMAFSADAAKILFAVDSKMEIVALPSGECQWALDVPSPVRGADFSPDDRLLATVSQPPGGSPATLWDPSTGAEVGRIGSDSGQCGYVKFSPDGRFLVSTEADDAVLWALVR